MTGQDAHSTNNFRKSRRHAIFSAAVELPADQRDAYLVNEFANEPDMLEELRSLLKYHDTMSAPSDLPPTPLDDPLIGTTIGSCQIERRIGAGGMGIVYQATQSHPRRQVAVKVLRPGTMNQDMLARLDREAELLGRLCHPGIARIYGSSTFDTGQGATLLHHGVHRSSASTDRLRRSTSSRPTSAGTSDRKNLRCARPRTPTWSRSSGSQARQHPRR
ncbi:MAG: protein kinase [Planctomycetes bacterium]|nr:protein kinase [Planctomycetota bacterium]